MIRGFLFLKVICFEMERQGFTVFWASKKNKRRGKKGLGRVGGRNLGLGLGSKLRVSEFRLYRKYPTVRNQPTPSPLPSHPIPLQQ